jgi:hypothetical protein
MLDARLEATTRSRGKTLTETLIIEVLRKDLTDYCPLGGVVDQARRRALNGEQVFQHRINSTRSLRLIRI